MSPSPEARGRGRTIVIFVYLAALVAAWATVRWLPEGLHLYSLFSSGTEAADVALRIACAVTGRRGAVGFRHGHHGKAVAVQQLTRDDDAVPEVTGFERIGFLPDVGEAEILDRLDAALAGHLDGHGLAGADLAGAGADALTGVEHPGGLGGVELTTAER